MSAERSAPRSIDSNPSRSFRETVSDAVRYWEPRRVAYNLILAAIVIAWVGFSWPHFRPAMKFESFVLLVVLATLANVCYCAAYVADVPMQFSLFRRGWLRWRWGVWAVGMLFAALLANYWIADEIFPFVR